MNTHERPRLARRLAAGLCSAILAGCAATEPVSSISSAPPDFTVSMSVLGKPAKRNLASIPRDQRPTRFVMETDWVLRAYAGPGVSETAFPPESRTLSHADVQALWDDLRSTGILEQGDTHPESYPAPAATAGTQPAQWIVTYTAAGVTRSIAITPEQQPRVRPLLDHLADLAFMPK